MNHQKVVFQLAQIVKWFHPLQSLEVRNIFTKNLEYINQSVQEDANVYIEHSYHSSIKNIQEHDS
jgi:hypothetical protein